MHRPLSNHEPATEPGREGASPGCMQTAWRCCAEWPGLETARRPATAARHGDVRDVHPMALHTATGAEDPRPLTAAGWTLQASKSHLEEGPLYNAVKIKIKKYEMNPWWQKNVFFFFLGGG